MTDEQLSVSQKIQILNDSKKLKTKWNNLTKEEKVKILEAMEASTDERWILLAFEELKG